MDQIRFTFVLCHQYICDQIQNQQFGNYRLGGWLMITTLGQLQVVVLNKVDYIQMVHPGQIHKLLELNTCRDLGSS